MFQIRKRGVALKLILGLAVLALFTGLAGIVAVTSFNEVQRTFNRVASVNLSTMASAAQLQQQSQALAAVAPGLLVKDLDQATLLNFSTKIYGQQAALQRLITELANQAADKKELEQVNAAAALLFENVDALSTAIYLKASLQNDFKKIIDELVRIDIDARQLSISYTANQSIQNWVETMATLKTVVLKSIVYDAVDQLAPLSLDVAWTLAEAHKIARGSVDQAQEMAGLQQRLMHTASGSEGIISIRSQLLSSQREIDDLLEKNEVISHRLVTAVDKIAASISADVTTQNQSLSNLLEGRSRILLLLAALGVTGALAIGTFIQLSVIGRLGRLRNAMLGGYTAETAKNLVRGKDEISEMARSVVNYVEEINRREEEIRQSDIRLTGAIESISDGFSLYNCDDMLVTCNQRYRELLYPGLEDIVQPGRSFGAIIRASAELGLIRDAIGHVDEWVAKRMEEHRLFTGTTMQQRSDGTWIEIKERRTEAGDIVAIYTDVTERRNFEANIMEAKRRTEEAHDLLDEKNRMLEGLSTKLSKYLSPQVYSSIFSGAQDVTISSLRKKLTVFFSDIADFTAMTDGLELEELTALLNDYLTEMSKIALDHGATIDKYIGDAIMAFFGDPESRGVQEDAIACVNMAVAMQRRMRRLQEEWRARGVQSPFALRIGINTGFCTVGNFGSEARMDYTIIGGEVNLASRLQAHAELGGILLAHETYALVKDDFRTEEMDPIAVKGLAKPVRVHRVVGIDDQLTPNDGIRYRGRAGMIELDVDSLSDSERDDLRAVVQSIIGRLEGEA